MSLLVSQLCSRVARGDPLAILNVLDYLCQVLAECVFEIFFTIMHTEWPSWA
jgi:hypothetical protein